MQNKKPEYKKWTENTKSYLQQLKEGTWKTKMSNIKEKINSSVEKIIMKTQEERSLRKKNNLGNNDEEKQQTEEGSPKKCNTHAE